MNKAFEALRKEIIKNKSWDYLANIPDRFLTVRKLENFIQSQQEEERKDLVLESLPYHLVVEPTNVCNLACPLCSTGLGSLHRSKGTMSFKCYRELIDSCKDFVLKIYLQNWGEPTISPHLPDMIKYAADSGIWTHVSTNFSVKYSKEYLEKLISSGLAVLQIDIDGTTQEIYEIYRKKGSLKQVIENVRSVITIKKNLDAKVPIIEAKMLVMRHNEHQLKEFEELANKLEVDKYGLSKIQVNPNKSLHWLPQDKDFIYDSYKGKNLIKSCHWPWSGLVINWDGGISPCCIVDDAREDFGNIFERSLNDVWNNDSFVSARSEFSEKKDITRRTICNSCKNNTHNKGLKRFGDSFSLVKQYEGGG